jgi:hypothetical protein
MSEYDDGGMSGILAAQEIQQWAAQAPTGKPADPPPWWELPALIVAIVALTCANVWLFRRERRDRQQ